ncbi:MAG: hypothetical protein ACM3SW_05145 [Actinomycetota bacterium]
MARVTRPKLCLIGKDMLTIQERSFPDALREASPDVEIFIAEESDISVSATQTGMTSSR